MIIDGPPMKVQKNARYPAVPLLYDKLCDGCIVLMDDGARKDESLIAEMWNREYRFASSEYLGLEKGAWVLVKSS